ncbi:zinc finger protein GAI-ASSOCIATED FACTOR 1-like isoform X1 [Lycium barbarum]|uniref:zinc finger protein GAI-ASSOCIATED FACTOR 1-like isoform X1 n=1 Tax=Lycium barbarum TaxID=112863 RepID=UPI00293E7DAB|nr:zinc finger protein GAI-ASSOCIATED FACTOR 1-like isoform X1 [Lycium barbarum]
MAEMEISSSMTVAGASLQETITQQKFPVKRKRNLPGNPDPEAEVIALSPKALMATNRFVCEICNKGFQRDQNLQLHRRGHNLPWKLRQRTSNEVRKRVYVCPEATCVHHDPSRALGDLTGIKKHFCRKHGEKKFKCERCTKKYAVQSDWKAHMKTCGTREYRCDCGTLFSRRDSFITHRAFCDALAQESARSQPLVTNTEGDLKVDEAVTKVASSSSSPPPQPLTPSTGVLSPVLSIQSSELPPDNQNQGGVQLQQAQGTTTPVSTVTTSTTMSTTTAVTGPSSSKVFASVFPSSSTSAEQAHSSYSDILRVIETEQMTTVEPMSLSLSSSFYLSNNGPALFLEHTGHGQHYGSTTTQPALSATALLQKAAQMGSTTSNNSFLRGLGLAMSSSTSAPDDISLARRTNSLGRVKLESNIVEVPTGLGVQVPTNGPSGLTDLMMGPSISHQSMMFGSRPPTLDFLGLGNGASGTPSNRFSAFLSSMEGGFGVVAEPWDDPSDRKPAML